MAKIVLELPDDIYKAVWSHLLPKNFLAEEAAFLFANRIGKNGDNVFRSKEWSPVLSPGFLSRSRFHLELSDETRAAAIKKAHDLGASLVEIHSHYGPWPARFSESDLLGFKEFVPHVWWRLKNRPYMAIVLSKTGFDGFVWIKDPRTPCFIDMILVGNLELTPTKLSLTRD